MDVSCTRKIALFLERESFLPGDMDSEPTTVLISPKNLMVRVKDTTGNRLFLLCATSLAKPEETNLETITEIVGKILSGRGEKSTTDYVNYNVEEATSTSFGEDVQAGNLQNVVSKHITNTVTMTCLRGVGYSAFVGRADSLQDVQATIAKSTMPTTVSYDCLIETGFDAHLMHPIATSVLNTPLATVWHCELDFNSSWPVNAYYKGSIGNSSAVQAVTELMNRTCYPDGVEERMLEGLEMDDGDWKVIDEINSWDSEDGWEENEDYDEDPMIDEEVIPADTAAEATFQNITALAEAAIARGDMPYEPEELFKDLKEVAEADFESKDYIPLASDEDIVCVEVISENKVMVKRKSTAIPNIFANVKIQKTLTSKGYK